MQNVKMSVDKKTLTITVDLGAKGTESKSGKSVVLASTEGNVTVPGTDVKIGLNVYRPK